MSGFILLVSSASLRSYDLLPTRSQITLRFEARRKGEKKR
jgi:hypothetical protein